MSKYSYQPKSYNSPLGIFVSATFLLFSLSGAACADLVFKWDMEEKIDIGEGYQPPGPGPDPGPGTGGDFTQGPGNGDDNASPGDDSNGGNVTQPEYSCSTATPGTIGKSGECQGMLIVNDFMLRSAASNLANPQGGEKMPSGDDFQNPVYEGGDLSYSIAESDQYAPDTLQIGDEYTFTDDSQNIFTGQVGDMSHLFRQDTFNGDIGYWDTSSATTMALMFAGNSSFNQNINSWDISNVADMRKMFSSATSFNKPIGDWDTSKVIDMSFMFSDAVSFNRMIAFDPLSGAWDTYSVGYMTGMFQGATTFNRDIGNWNTDNLTNADKMFQDATQFNHDLSGWCVASVTSFGDPIDFDLNAGFYNNETKQPNWGDPCL